MNIQEAIDMLREVIPATERAIAIQVEVWHHQHSPDRLDVEFGVWDQKDHYKAPSLELAVHKCLLGNAPIVGQVSEADAAVVETEQIVTEQAALPPSPIESTLDEGDIPF